MRIPQVTKTLNYSSYEKKEYVSSWLYKELTRCYKEDLHSVELVAPHKSSNSAYGISEYDVNSVIEYGKREKDFWFVPIVFALFGRSFDTLKGFASFVSFKHVDKGVCTSLRRREIEGSKVRENNLERMTWQSLTQRFIYFMDSSLPYVEGLKIDVGSGKSRRPGCVAIDKTSAGQVVCDVGTVGLPFNGGEVSEIYACHFLEHLDEDKLCFFFEDAYKVLEVGGRINAIVPYFNTMLSASSPQHKTLWSELTIREMCSGYNEIYSSEHYGFHFKLSNRLLWGKRLNRLHLHFVLQKITKEEADSYKNGEAYQNFLFGGMTANGFQDTMVKFLSSMGYSD